MSTAASIISTLNTTISTLNTSIRTAMLTKHAVRLPL